MTGAGLSVAIRADGSASVGLGHVTRSLALGASLVAQGFHVDLLSRGLPVGLADRARQIGVLLHDAEEVAGGADALQVAQLEPDLVVVDGYEFGPAFFGGLAENGCLHAVVDDNGDTSAVAPVMIVNQNPHASAAMYERFGDHPRLLLGLDYVLLREEIRGVRRDTVPDRDTGVVQKMRKGE